MSATTLYRTLVADPPWVYEGYATMPGSARKTGHVTKRVSMPYDTLPVERIRRLPVGDIADRRGARLFLWTTNLYLRDAFSILDAWGFRYQQTLVWHKTGNPSPFGGSVAPNHAEFLLVGTTGTPELLTRLSGSVIAAPKPYTHSQKPEVFLDLIESCSPEPRIEIFARRQRLGWDTWGKEAFEHVEMTA